MKRRRQRGFTLIELIVMIGVASTVLGLASVSLHTLFHVQRQLRERMLGDQAFARLYVRFVTDVHAAHDARVRSATTPGGDAAVLVLNMNKNQRIVYQATDNGSVKRSVHTDNQVVARDTYRLPTTWQVRFVVPPAATKKMISMRIQPRTAASREPQHELAWHADAEFIR